MRAVFRKTGKCEFTIIMLVLSAFCFFLPAFARAGSITPVQGLEMLRRSFSGVTDFTADITQDKQISLMKKTMKASGVVRFRKPDTFYMELYSPYPSRVLLRDTSLAMVLPKEGVRQKIMLPGEESLKRWFGLLDSPVAAVPAGVDVRAETRGRYVTLKIVPGKKGSVRELRVTFLENEGISRLVIEERNNDRTVINFRNMKKNVGLKEKDFYLE
ncbi:MAG TPA: outer membrane lipoprotein carrier protein LolA [Geobacteraceae bacterium]|nr:outer membrane lipoprotein carrier protein LolA [Geobacteraceae bacterium]